MTAPIRSVTSSGLWHGHTLDTVSAVAISFTLRIGSLYCPTISEASHWFRWLSQSILPTISIARASLLVVGTFVTFLRMSLIFPPETQMHCVLISLVSSMSRMMLLPITTVVVGFGRPDQWVALESWYTAFILPRSSALCARSSLYSLSLAAISLAAFSRSFCSAWMVCASVVTRLVSYWGYLSLSLYHLALFGK